MVAELKSESYEFVPLPSTYRVLPDALRELKTFSFWCIPGAEKEKQPGYWNGSKWVFTEWQKVKNLEWIGDAVRLSHDLKVNVGLVVPDCWVVADFDKCRDPVTGDIHPTVRRIIERLKTVVLISSSRTGLHVFLKYRPDQPLPDKSQFTNPDLNLDIFEIEKRGELKKPGTFVAINWHPLPGYNALDKTVQQFPEWLEAELFIREETVPLTEPLEPITLVQPVANPQTRAPRESEPKEPPFGIKWEPNYLAHVKAVFAGFDDPMEGSDPSISYQCVNWVSIYIMGAKTWTYDRAIHLSKQVEGKCLAKNPTRNKKSHKWHEEKVISRIRLFSELGLLVYRKKHDREGKMPFDILKLEALDYALATKMKPRTEKVFLTIVVLSKGRSGFKLRDARVAEASGLDRGTVIKAKKEIRKGDFLKIEGARNNTYTII